MSIGNIWMDGPDIILPRVRLTRLEGIGKGPGRSGDHVVFPFKATDGEVELQRHIGHGGPRGPFHGPTRDSDAAPRHGAFGIDQDDLAVIGHIPEARRPIGKNTNHLKRLVEIEQLDKEQQKTIVYVLDSLLRDAKAKKAYEGQGS